jgi:hypothetical protein
MAAITDPLATAAIVFFLGAAAARLFQFAEGGADEMEAKMVFHLMLGPACLAVIILILSGTADHLYLAR